MTPAQREVLRRSLDWMRRAHVRMQRYAPDTPETLGLGIAVDELQAMLRHEDDTARLTPPGR